MMLVRCSCGNAACGDVIEVMVVRAAFQPAHVGDWGNLIRPGWVARVRSRHLQRAASPLPLGPWLSKELGEAALSRFAV